MCNNERTNLKELTEKLKQIFSSSSILLHITEMLNKDLVFSFTCWFRKRSSVFLCPPDWIIAMVFVGVSAGETSKDYIWYATVPLGLKYSKRTDLISTILATLYLLPFFFFRIDCKIVLFLFKALNDQTLASICDLQTLCKPLAGLYQ